VRNSTRAPLDPTDEVVACIAERALAFQGWPDDTFIERMWTQKYEPGGHYGGHFDWAGDLRRKAGRVSTFMVYVACENCIGGGTTFPKLDKKAVGEKWCDMVECEETPEKQGITFKPVAGNAIYWENFRPDGRGWEDLWHMADRVVEGEKVGLNIWSWFQEGYGNMFEEQRNQFYGKGTSDEL
jgi:prolyl 4-hydroxylase